MKKQISFTDRVIQQLNSARLYPKNYAKMIRGYINYFKGNIIKYPGLTPIMTTEGPKAFEEAALFLEQQKNMPKSCMLTSNKDLETICKSLLDEVATESDLANIESVNLATLIEKAAIGKIKGVAFQCLDLDSEMAEFIVANIIVDDGNKSRSNRAKLFNEKLRIVGVAKGEHEEFTQSTFILAAEDFQLNEAETETEEETEKFSENVTILRKSCLEPELRRNIKDLVEALRAVEAIEERFGSKDKEIIEICNKNRVESKGEEEENNENVVKMTRSEQIIKIEDKDVKIVVINKVYKDGTVSTEKTKEFLN